MWYYWLLVAAGAGGGLLTIGGMITCSVMSGKIDVIPAFVAILVALALFYTGYWAYGRTTG